MEKSIKLDYITKIEGHASLNLKIDKGKVKRCELSSTEGARYFEGILLGKRFFEANEISSRICGICSSAHTVCATMAIEDALHMRVSDQTVKLRELITLGERIRSHSTHLYFLALPDYLGFESALSMLPKYKREIERAICLNSLGNSMIRINAGRDLHPVSVTIGGMLKLPRKEDLKKLKKVLFSARKPAEETVKLFAGLKNRSFVKKRDFISLSHPHKYAILHGSITSQLSHFERHDFHNHIKEYHEPYTTANFVVKEGRSFRVGALSRINNNYRHLSKSAQRLLRQSNIRLPNYNPFYNNLAQAIEIVHCIDHAINILENLNIKNEFIPSFEDIHVKRSHGISAIEVPRGTLWHEYKLDNDGKIIYANIITPTAQNLRAIEGDIKEFVPSILRIPKEKIVLEIEKLIRAYDPCFSCSTHFLKVNWL